MTCKVDVTKKADIGALFDDLAAKELVVDVLVLNAAKFAGLTPLLEVGAIELWTNMEANIKGPMLLTETFMKQNPGKQNVS